MEMIKLNQEELQSRKIKGEKIVEYVYKVSCGKEETHRYEKEIEYVCEKGFMLKGYKYYLPFDCFGRWGLRNYSSNLYEYGVYLPCEESVENYLPEIKALIAQKLRGEIERLEQSLKIVS